MTEDDVRCECRDEVLVEPVEIEGVLTCPACRRPRRPRIRYPWDALSPDRDAGDP